MKKSLLLVLVALGVIGAAPASAQQPAQAFIVATCGTLPTGVTYAASTYGVLTMDTTGKLCDSATGGGGGGGAITAAAGSYSAGAFVVGTGVDGWDTTEGSTTDAAAAAGGVGTVSAKLREVTALLNSILSGVNGSIPAGTNTIGAVLATPDTRPGSGSITIVDTGSSTASGFRGVSIVTGTPTAASFVTQAVNGLSVHRFQLSGTWTGTITFEQSVDLGTTWETLGCHVNGADFNVSAVTANGIFDCQPAGATNIRARATAAVTGTAVVTMTITTDGGIVRVLSGESPATSFHLIAANSDNSTSIKTIAGKVVDYQTGNINASTSYYLKMYDKASAPTCGTDTPIATFLIPPTNGGNNGTMPIGKAFLLGLGICVTAGIADNDNTSVPAATVIVNLDYK